MVDPKGMFQELFSSDKYQDIIKKGEQGSIRTLTIDYNDIKGIDLEIAEDLLNNPETFRKFSINALEGVIPTTKVRNISYINIPEVPLKEVKTSDYEGKLASTQGIVRVTGEIRPRPYIITYECSCLLHEIKIVQDNPDELISPGVCPECGKAGLYSPINVEYVDTQWIKIHEIPEGMEQGTQPVELKVVLEDDLTRKKVQPGDLIKLTGINSVMEVGTGKKKQYYFYMKANNIELEDKRYEDLDITSEEEEELIELSKDPQLEEKIYNTIAPRITGYKEEKKALALALFGGVPEEEEDGVLVRGDIHILLLGDPGIGKSHILKHISGNLAPRGIYTTGGGSSGVGLTASVRKDTEFSGEYILEAGAMVLGDKGLVCIDEFDKLDKEERGKIHEPLSDQTISIAKGGIVSTLNCRCTVLAGANPKGDRIDRYKSIREQINLPRTIIDRFDLVFILEDNPIPGKDEEGARIILNKMYRGEKMEGGLQPALLRKYIAYSKRNYEPEIEEDAVEKGIDYFVKSRSNRDPEDPIPISYRFIHSYKKLAQARARMFLRNSVTLEDMDKAIELVNYALLKVGMDPVTGKIDIDKVEGGTPASTKELRKIANDIFRKYEEDCGEGGKWIQVETIRNGAVEDFISISKSKDMEVTRELAEEEIKKVVSYMVGGVEDLE